MSKNDFYWQCIEFHDVWRSNVQDVRRFALDTFMFFLSVPCMFRVFYVFTLVETRVEGPKHVMVYIYI